MIQRKTLILIAIFVIMLAGFLYINQDSNLQTSLGMQTATATQQPLMVIGFDLTSVSTFDLSSTSGPNVKIFPVVHNGTNVLITDKNEPVNLLSISQVIKTVTGMRGTVSPDQTVPLDKIGLNPPQAKLVLTDGKGNKGTLFIGSPTATQSDYYVKWENSPVTLVSKTQIDSLLGFFAPDSLIAPTPEPNITATP